MKPQITRFKAAKLRLGLSARLLAQALDPIRPPNPRTIRRWEAGDPEAPDWAWRRMDELLRDAGLPLVGRDGEGG